MLLIKPKNGKEYTAVCLVPVERDPVKLENLEAFSCSNNFSEGIVTGWIDQVLPYFNATRGELHPHKPLWIFPSDKQPNVLHALIVLTRSASDNEIWRGPFPIPKGKVDPLQYLFTLYKKDLSLPHATLFSNFNHGYQATYQMMESAKIPIDKLSLSKLITDLKQCKDKVDACWRNGNRVGLVS